MISFASLTLFLSCKQNFIDQTSTKKQNNYQNTPSFAPKVIYGEDNRLDLYQVSNKNIWDLEQGVAGLVRSSEISKKKNGNYKINTQEYGSDRELCEDEKFYSQDISTFCTGFLIADDTLVTAGHCILNKKRCENVHFVFGLSKYKKEDSINYSNIDKNNVYTCKKIVHSIAETLDGQDFAIVKLDRKVKDREPLRFRRYGQPALSTKTILIGKPTGLPTKVAAGANITKHTRYQFQSNNDAYAGNSGSPVFNSKTGVVEGILVKGALDFIYNKKKSCKESHRCKNIRDQTICGGEFSQYIADILPYVDERQAQTVYENKTVMNIPDNDVIGVKSEIQVPIEAKANQRVLIHLNIAHSWTGDLKIYIIAPTGEQLLIFNNHGEYGQDLRLTYGELPEEQKALTEISSQKIGLWKLHVIDEFSRDQGALKSWAIEVQ